MQGALIVRPNWLCNICALPLVDADEPFDPKGVGLVVVENGKILPMHKDPSYFVFHSWADVPPENMPEGVETEISVWHEKCWDDVYNTVDDEQHAVSSRYCSMCDRDFDDDPYGNQITVGNLDVEEEVFIEDGSTAQRKMCVKCVWKVARRPLAAERGN